MAVNCGQVSPKEMTVLGTTLDRFDSELKHLESRIQSLQARLGWFIPSKPKPDCCAKTTEQRGESELIRRLDAQIDMMAGQCQVIEALLDDGEF